METGRLPVEKTAFSEQLLEYNGLRNAGFHAWAFRPGMLFRARGKWWGDRGTRALPHEGIDLCLYTDESGRLSALGPSTRIPVMFAGEVVKVEKDFLGQSVYVAHAIDNGDGGRLWTIYGHTRPAEHVRPGKRLGEGEIIASLAKAGKGDGKGLLTHLHLSMAWISTGSNTQEVNWKTLHEPGVAVLLDPLHAMDCPYRILDPDVPIDSSRWR